MSGATALRHFSTPSRSASTAERPETSSAQIGATPTRKTRPTERYEHHSGKLVRLRGTLPLPPATGEVVADLVLGTTPFVDVRGFALERFVAGGGRADERIQV